MAETHTNSVVHSADALGQGASRDAEVKARRIMHTLWLAVSASACVVMILGFVNFISLASAFIGLAIASIVMFILMLIGNRKVPNPVAMPWVSYVASILRSSIRRSR